MEFEEQLVLNQLIKNEQYFLKVVPFLDDSLFSNKITKSVFNCIKLYHDTYNRKPTEAVIDLYVNNAKSFTDDQFTQLRELGQYVKTDNQVDNDWLEDSTIEWIRKRKYYNAILDGASELDKGKLDLNLSDKLNEALSVTFDTTIGMEFSDAQDRWNKYNCVEERIPFDLEIFNTITGGGITKKTLNVFMSSDTGGFKSGTMVHLAASDLKSGKNVLFISLEMAEERVLERIDANLLDIEIDNLKNIGQDKYIEYISKIQAKTRGRLIVKQFPTAQCHVGHIRYFLKELKLKKKFVPDIIYIDYLNIMASMRMKDSGNSYGYIKAISEEVRGLAIEYDVPIWSATQSNRGGAGNEELSITDISDSYGVTFGVDMLIGIITTPEFDEQGKILYCQLKNRYRDKNSNNKFFLGVNKAKMKLFEITPVQKISTNEELTENFNSAVANIKSRRKEIKL